ncbi:hypothetical protein MP228_001538 [Amoeboaphelidium protococcarum]|nr:hypothetical protein MP228_001538 [Amoeboaphelidium protococcarum]
MPSYNIEGTQIEFPYDAYDLQLNFMATIIRALNTSTNALIESPTGTGKAISLLCPTLAWLQQQNQKKSLDDYKIYFASRTHSQLTQIIKELKRSAYRKVKMAILGSRDQMCVNDQVRTLNTQGARNAKCKKLVQERQCEFSNNTHKVNDILDIEELTLYGRQHTQCPYYISKENQTNAELIVLPYNYLIDPHQRELMNISLKNAILIFDESHNLESFCNESASFEITSRDVLQSLNDLQQLKSYLQSNSSAVDVQGIVQVRDMIASFGELIEQNMSGSKSGIVTQNGQFIKDLFQQVHVESSNYERYISVLNDIEQLLNDLKRVNSSISIWADALRIVFTTAELSSCFKVHLKQDQQQQQFHRQQISFHSRVKNSGWVLNLWCFAPSVAMRRLMADGARSIILASGTLSPLDSFASEMGIPFKEVLQNPHIINNDQLLVGVLTKGPMQVSFNASYENRSASAYLADLGNALVNFARIVPSGMLVFFPSYVVMQNCIQSWSEQKAGQADCVMSRLKKLKEVFTEPKDKNQFNDSILEYYALVKDPQHSGAIFFAVCRGKASEGIDFSDGKGRAVVITGLPFPALKDAKVILKRQFLDDNKQFGLSGSTWYTQQAYRAVNQALGRVIRHKNDWGAILLCDERFSQQSVIDKLPKWLRDQVQVFKQFGEAQFQLRQFISARVQWDKENMQNLPADSKSVSQDYSAPNAGVANDNMQIGNQESGSLTLKIKQEVNVSSVKQVHNEQVQPLADSDNRVDLQQKIVVYKSQLRQSFSSEEYKLFQQYVKEYKSRKIRFEQMISSMLALLDHKDKYHLFRGMQSFVPKHHHEQFQNAWHLLEGKYKQQSDAVKSAKQQNKSMVCTICKKDVVSPFKNKCGHLACHNCWVILFKVQNSCMICQSPASLRLLEKLYYRC